MNRIRKRLEQLLLKKDWNEEDRNWMLEYLKANDLTLLQTITKEQFDSDINVVQNILDEGLSVKILNEIHAKIKSKKRKRTLSIITIAAASILLLFSVGYIYKRYESIHKVSPDYVEIDTKPGQTKKIQLADGTQVWLSPSSSLKYPVKFTGSFRKVKLSGEAFFKVRHDAIHPFMVKSEYLTIKVLGTSFDINTYENRNYATVTVATGEVAVNDNHTSEAPGNDQIKLIANQRVVFTTDNWVLKKEDFPDAARILFARRNGVLEYDGADLQEVMEDLSVQYGVKIELSDTLQNVTYYGSFNVKEDNLKVSLKLLCLTLGGKIKKDGDVYVIER